MAQEKVARVHSHKSHRAKPKDAGERKIVFKSVLDNPHRVSWPVVPANVQNTILAHLVDLLDGVAKFHQSRCRSSKRRKRVANESSHRSIKRRVVSKDAAIGQDDLVEGPSTFSISHHTESSEESSEPPPILNSLIYGINAVTKRLEIQIENSRVKSVFKYGSKTRATGESTNPIRFLFVCRADIDPPILIDHLPHLVATYNALRQEDFHPIVLATLPKGAETTLAQVIGVRRLAALAISASSAISQERFATVADSIAPVTAPWLTSTPARLYVQSHIKQIRTTAPRDMKAAKESRAKWRAVAKSRRSKLRKADAITKDASTGAHSISR
ncbi:RNase P and RNase MRP subunit [Leucoagaricus gongylophorus]